MLYHVLLDGKTKKKSSQHLFAIQLAKQAYIDKGIEEQRMKIVDDNGKVFPDFANA